MKKLTMPILIAILVSLSGCASLSYRHGARLDAQKAYLAIHIQRDDQRFRVLNLDTGERTNFTFPAKRFISIIDVAPGRYAVYDISKVSTFGLNTVAEMTLPLYLMTMLEVEANSMTYLGNFRPGSTPALAPWQPGSYSVDYGYDEFVFEIQEHYELPPGFRLQPVPVIQTQFEIPGT